MVNIVLMRRGPESLVFFAGYIYMQKRQYQEARIDYNVVLDKDAKNRTALLGMVVLDEKEGRYISAINRLNLLIQNTPDEQFINLPLRFLH